MVTREGWLLRYFAKIVPLADQGSKYLRTNGTLIGASSEDGERNEYHRQAQL